MEADDMVKMMDKMTGALFAGMTADEKFGLMQTMMTVCLTNILTGLSAEEQQRVAERAISQLAAGLKEQAGLV
jgi:hypothetical protein